MHSGYVGASFGYVLGFIAAAILCGFSWLSAERDRSVLRAVPVMIAGEVVIYAFRCDLAGAEPAPERLGGASEGFTPFMAGDADRGRDHARGLPGPGGWPATAPAGPPARPAGPAWARWRKPGAPASRAR